MGQNTGVTEELEEKRAEQVGQNTGVTEELSEKGPNRWVKIQVCIKSSQKKRLRK